MNNFTPGPWRRHSFIPLNILSPAGVLICDCCNAWAGTRPNEREDNARLIAAAPELLAALIELIDTEDHGDDIDIFNRARAAVAKAMFAPERAKQEQMKLDANS